MHGKTLAYLSKCGMIAKANIAAFVVKNCKERELLLRLQAEEAMTVPKVSSEDMVCNVITLF